MDKRIAGEIVDTEIKSREGTIYITEKYVYKVFGGRTNPYDQLLNYKTAETRGVPVPDTAKFTAELQDGSTKQTIGGLRSTRAFGRFFQLSKPGGEKTLINEINKAFNRVLLSSIITGLENAAQLGVTDPQGFISVTSNPPLTFIDIHFIETPSPIFECVLEAARVKLIQLA